MNYKKKYYLLLIAIIILALLSYRLSIKKSIELFDIVENLEQKVETINQSPEKIKLLEQKLSLIDVSINNTDTMNVDFQESLMEKIGQFSSTHPIILRDYPQPTSFRENDYEINTNQLTFEGKFQHQLMLLHELENNFKSGKISSVHFYSKKDNKTQKTSLYGTFYIQNFKKD